MYTCNQCQRSFTNSQSFNGHKNKHLSEEKQIVKNKKLTTYLLDYHLNRKIREENDYNKNPKYCLQCNKKLLYSKKHLIFCTHSCSAKYTNLRREKPSDEQKLKTSESLKNYCNSNPVRVRIYKPKPPKIVRYCIKCNQPISKKNKFDYCQKCWFKSDEFQKHIGKYKNYNKQYVYNKWTDKWIYLQSLLEQMYVLYLDKNNIKWIRPEPLKYIKENTEHLYFPDFYLIDSQKYIEIKGYMWKEDRIKMGLVIEQYPEHNIEIIYKKDIKKLLKD